MEPLSFRTEIHPMKYTFKINHTHKLLFIGSCFADNLSKKLNQHKFNTLNNPFGVLFNPASIAHRINDILFKKNYDENDLTYYNEEWISFKHHGSFSNPDKQKCLHQINSKLKESKIFIKNVDFVFITLGTSIAYQLKSSKEIVSNCHKFPASHFVKVFLSADESLKLLYDCIINVNKINPNVKIIFTLSPIRYIKDDFIENSLSKAHLRIAIHELTKKFSSVFYFPAFEILMDDLRDYRFYNPDKIHPSETAIDYMWNFFSQAFFNAETMKCNNYIKDINMALLHKPKNKDSQLYKLFKDKQLKKVYNIMQSYPYLDFKNEIKFFST